MIQGHFIVFEGIDGSGTTTQAEELRKRFVEYGLPAHVTAEPSAGPVGSIIRQILSGRLVIRHQHGMTAPSWKTLSLLFAADRQDHVESEILPNLSDGVNVICDRYVYSSVVYQSVSSGDEKTTQWILEVNRYMKKPDLVIHLRVNPEEALKRRMARGGSTEIFDDPQFQARLAHAYDNLESMFEETHVVTVDADGSIDQIAKECWTHVERVRAEGAPA